MPRLSFSFRFLWLAFLLAITALAADQLTKALVLKAFTNPSFIVPVLPSFNLRLGFNSGVSFGLFATDQPLILAALTLSIIGILLWWVLQAKAPIEAAALGAVIGGAVGNLIDRLRHGAVVDFIDIYYREWHWPTFNVADMFIVSGVGTLVLSSLLLRKLEPDNVEQ